MVHLGVIHKLRNLKIHHLKQYPHFGVNRISFFYVNRVEHQKRNQPAIEKWPFGFVFGVQLGLRQTQALIKTSKKNLRRTSVLVVLPLLGLNQCLCVCRRPSWTPKTKPNDSHSAVFFFYVKNRLLCVKKNGFLSVKMWTSTWKNIKSYPWKTSVTRENF